MNDKISNLELYLYNKLGPDYILFLSLIISSLAFVSLLIVSHTFSVEFDVFYLLSLSPIFIFIFNIFSDEFSSHLIFWRDFVASPDYDIFYQDISDFYPTKDGSNINKIRDKYSGDERVKNVMIRSTNDSRISTASFSQNPKDYSILISSHILNRISEKGVMCLIEHEINHIKRKDYLRKDILLFSLILFSCSLVFLLFILLQNNLVNLIFIYLIMILVVPLQMCFYRLFERFCEFKADEYALSKVDIEGSQSAMFARPEYDISTLRYLFLSTHPLREYRLKNINRNN